MWVTAKDTASLTGFPLLWRWTNETHARFEPNELAAIRPIQPAKAATIWERLASTAADLSTEDRILAKDDPADPLVRRWLADRVPTGESDVILLWDRATAAVVPRPLFIDRWSDFWYPSSDDLTVTGVVGRWRIQMCHDGMFDFSVGAAFEQGVDP